MTCLRYQPLVVESVYGARLCSEKGETRTRRGTRAHPHQQNPKSKEELSDGNGTANNVFFEPRNHTYRANDLSKPKGFEGLVNGERLTVFLQVADHSFDFLVREHIQGYITRA